VQAMFRYYRDIFTHDYRIESRNMNDDYIVILFGMCTSFSQTPKTVLLIPLGYKFAALPQWQWLAKVYLMMK
jgi:hypothetical protein